MTHCTDVRNEGNSSSNEQDRCGRPRQQFGCDLEYDRMRNLRLHTIEFNDGYKTLDPDSPHSPGYIDEVRNICEHAFQAELRTWNLVVELDDTARQDLYKILDLFSSDAYQAEPQVREVHSPLITASLCLMVERYLLAFACGERVVLPDDANFCSVYDAVMRHPIRDMPAVGGWDSDETRRPGRDRVATQRHHESFENHVIQPTETRRERLIELDRHVAISSNTTCEEG